MNPAVVPDASASCPAPVTFEQVAHAFDDEGRVARISRGPTELTYRSWGSGPPLYLLPPLSGTGRLLAPLMWLLRDERRCVLLEYPRRSYSRSQDGNRAVVPLADDLFAVADQVGDASFPIFGAGFGGLIALAAMSQPASERIEAAVIQGGFAHRDLSAVERRLIRLGRRCPGRMGRVPGYRPLMRHTHWPWFPPFDVSRRRALVEDLASVPIAALAERAARVRDADLRDDVAEIDRTVLLLGCEGDGAVGARHRAFLESRLSAAESEYLAGCGVFPYLTHPHRVAQSLKEFLSRGGTDCQIAGACGTVRTATR